jgi:SAM-dependent methyltransferase
LAHDDGEVRERLLDPPDATARPGLPPLHHQRLADMGLGDDEVVDIEVVVVLGVGDRRLQRLLDLARNRLAPLGVEVRVPDGDELPATDGEFDLVINHHGGALASEIARVLRPGGTYLMQGVGSHNLADLNQALGAPSGDYAETSTLDATSAALQAAGLEIVDGHEHDRQCMPGRHHVCDQLDLFVGELELPAQLRDSAAMPHPLACHPIDLGAGPPLATDHHPEGPL